MRATVNRLCTSHSSFKLFVFRDLINESEYTRRFGERREYTEQLVQRENAERRRRTWYRSFHVDIDASSML